MQEVPQSAQRQTRTSTNRRYWERSNTAKSWWPGGVLPLLGLAVLFLFGALVTAPRIEADVRNQVSHRLSATGVNVTSLAVSGQHVRVAANADANAAPYVHAIAKVAQCDTWVGRLTCPAAVDLTIAAADPADAPLANDRCNARFSEILTRSAIYFRSGSATIGPENDAVLEQLAGVAQRCAGSMTIEGHTDSVGDSDINRLLSQARADSVRDALQQRGVDAARITAVGHGDSQPIANNATLDGRAKNRRIVITVNDMKREEQ